MVCVGIDVAKDKHDCCILDSEGTTLVDCFTIPNNMDGFKSLLQTIQDCSQKSDKIKVGLEATGHYSYNILGFLLDNDLPVYVMNPLHTNLYRKSLTPHFRTINFSLIIPYYAQNYNPFRRIKSTEFGSGRYLAVGAISYDLHTKNKCRPKAAWEFYWTENRVRY